MKKIVAIIFMAIMATLGYGQASSNEALLTRIQALEKQTADQVQNTKAALQLMQRPVWYLVGFTVIPEKKGLAVVYSEPLLDYSFKGERVDEIVFFDPGLTLGLMLKRSSDAGVTPIPENSKIRFRPISHKRNDEGYGTTVCGGLLAWEWAN